MIATRSLEDRLKHSIRRGRVLTAPAQLAGYDADGLGYKTFRPDAVAIPADVGELTALLADTQSLGVPVTIRGAGTSLSGGPVAAQGGVVVHTSMLRGIPAIRPEGFWCEVECSVTLSQLDAALQPHGLFYPPDPSSGPVCTIGGNVAMNAGGAHCFRYGVTSNYVLGMEAVLLDGSVRRFGGPAGGRGAWCEDWKRLMVGSEGTLAAFTRFWLRLLPRPEKAWTFRATFADLVAAERAIHALVADPSFPVAIELMDPRCVAMVENSPMAVGLPQDAFLLVTEIEGPAALVDRRVTAVEGLLREAGALDVLRSDDPAQRERLWKARKVAGGLMGQLSPDMFVQDAVIPKRTLADVLQMVYDEADAAGVPTVNVFHAGDGNLHPNFLFDARNPGELAKVEAISKRLMERVVAVGGTLSGEHGIGNDKAAYMPLVFTAETLRLQLAVPAIFNPTHQLNPLKVFGGRRFGGPPTDTATPVRAVSTSGPSTQTNGARLFDLFLDDVDGVTCVAATTTLRDLHARLAPSRLRFPLVLDCDAALRDQVAASGHAPGSSRFGPFCDNIVGMNWRLPDGRVVRIGERVVKSTTGYDLLRFLLNSTGRFGEPVDYVLRLRPDCGRNGIFYLDGDDASIARAVAELLPECWTNWFDSVDVLVDGETTRERLRIGVNCPADEWSLHEAFLRSLAATHGLTLEGESAEGMPADGCPDLMCKTTPDRAPALARQIASESGFTCVALCYCGVVHGYTNGGRARIAGTLDRLAAELDEIGGECWSRHAPRRGVSAVEAQWLAVLEQEFARS